MRNNNVLASLGVPIKKQNHLPETFAIPTPKIAKPIIIEKPVVTDASYKAEPTLDYNTYRHILKLVFDVGQQIERMPSTYSDKTEENLRDHFLLFLEPNFKGSATGETFNKSGKTDILLRYDGRNVFIAECKFWAGAKLLLDTITQLLGYLTWRDSKAAVIIFVKNKDFSSVINQIDAIAASHPNYLGFVQKQQESWIDYRFHIDGDKNREVKLAIILFHFPSD